MFWLTLTFSNHHFMLQMPVVFGKEANNCALLITKGQNMIFIAVEHTGLAA